MKPLDADEILVLDSLVRSPVFPVLRKLIALQRETELQSLIAAKDKDEMLRLQGRIHGLNLILNLPVIISEKCAKVAQEKKEKS